MADEPILRVESDYSEDSDGTQDKLIVEFEVIPTVDSSDPRQVAIRQGLSSLEEQLADNQQRVELLNKEIDRLTNHADGLDYTVAVASGILTGLIDAFFVGEFSLEKANEIGGEKANKFVVKVAQAQGYKGNDTAGAVQFLEKKHPLAADKATNRFGGGLQHHLRDFSHHPTPVGLVFSLLTQFTGNVYGTNTAGVFQVVPLAKDASALIGKSIPEKIILGVVNWFFHMVSDMAGSSGTLRNMGSGTGVPGPLLSLLKEVSALPIFSKLDANGNKEFSVLLSKLFNGTLLGKRGADGKLVPVKFDLRTEIGIGELLKKQAIPVIINECIVRGFYFIRRLIAEIKSAEVHSFKELSNINWSNTLPFKNRTIVRMLTIATGTFVAIDLADAAVRAAKDGAATSVPAFLMAMALRVNFVGIGRFAVSIGTDIGMGVKRAGKRNERLQLMSQQLLVYHAVFMYKEANMWIAAENAGVAIDRSRQLLAVSVEYYLDSLQQTMCNLQLIGLDINKIREYDPAFIEALLARFAPRDNLDELLLNAFGSPDGELDEAVEKLKKLLQESEAPEDGSNSQ